jgi:hypothetical protein
MRKALSCFAVCVAFGFLTSVGCSGDSLVPVEGNVTLNNEPLANATVTLSPVQATAPGPFVGVTNSNGRYALGPVGNDGAGAASGEYFLIITTVKQPAGGMEDSPLPTQKEIVPSEYRNGTKRFNVPEGGTNQANFDLKSR